MPFSPLTWVNKVTKLGPTNLNRIEQGVDDAHAGLIDDLAIATGKIADLAVTTGKINDLAVTSGKLAANAVTAAKIAADTITAAEIAANAISASELADNAVDNAALADNAVNTAELVDGAVTTPKIAAGVLPTLYRKTTEKDVFNTTSETDLLNDEITIAANVLGTSRMIRCTLVGDYLNNSGAARDLTVAVKFGATTLWADAALAITASATRRPFHLWFAIGNLGATNSQFLSGFVAIASPLSTTGLGNLAGPIGNETDGWQAPFGGSAAEDTTASKALKVTATHPAADANLSLRLKYALIEII